MTETERRNPDEILADVQREEARARRGRLRIFFGASAGVGKTYSMLEGARAARAGGTDIVVGYVEPHGRVETERLLEGLEQLPFLEVCYRGITRHEFDLDAALHRAPATGVAVHAGAIARLADVAGTPPRLARAARHKICLCHRAGQTIHLPRISAAVADQGASRNEARPVRRLHAHTLNRRGAGFARTIARCANHRPNVFPDRHALESIWRV